MSDELKPSHEWQKRLLDERGWEILDPDGWDRTSEGWDRSWNEPITYDEFLERAMRSTLMMHG